MIYACPIGIEYQIVAIENYISAWFNYYKKLNTTDE